MTPHLGEQASALVDNQLSGAEQERAFMHLAQCASCVEEVTAIRQARALLHRASQVPSPRLELMDSLIRLEVSGPPAQFASPIPALDANPFLVPQSVTASGYRGDISGPQGLARHWPKYVAGLTVSALCASMYVLGGRPTVTPRLTALATQEHLSRTLTTHDFAPVSEVAQRDRSGMINAIDWPKLESWLAAHKYAVPQNLPASVTVERVGFSVANPGELEMILGTDVGQVMLTETYGQLDLSAVSALPPIEHESGNIYVISQSPAHLIWQSGENVVELSSTASVSQIGQMTEQFAVSNSDQGLADRMVRGLTQITGVQP